jgi:hypothetical protein
MKRFKKCISLSSQRLRMRWFLASGCAVLTLLWVACAPGNFQFNQDDSTLITVVPDGATINVGEQLQYTVELTKKGITTNADPTLFNWVSSAPSVATVDNHGLAVGLKSGNVNIKAQSKSQSSNAGGASLTVQAAPPIATLAAVPQALLVRFDAPDREVSYAIDAAHRLLRTTITYADGSSSQRETFAPELTGGEWLAIDRSGRSLYVLSPTSRRILVFGIDPMSELTEGPTRIRVESDVFAIAAGSNDGIKLRHLTGRETRVQIRR